MKLKEALEDMNPEQVIKLGSNKGSSFFYIGKVKSLLKNMDAENERVRNMAVHKVEVSQRSYDLAFNATVSEKLKEYARKQIEKMGSGSGAIPPPKNTTNKATLAYFKKLSTMRTSYNRALKHLNEYVALPEREVKEKYLSLIREERAVIIIISGHETGDMWLVSEAKEL